MDEEISANVVNFGWYNPARILRHRTPTRLVMMA